MLMFSLRSLRIFVISALNISLDYSNAEITEIRRDRRKPVPGNCAYNVGEKPQHKSKAAENTKIAATLGIIQGTN